MKGWGTADIRLPPLDRVGLTPIHPSLQESDYTCASVAEKYLQEMTWPARNPASWPSTFLFHRADFQVDVHDEPVKVRRETVSLTVGKAC